MLASALVLGVCGAASLASSVGVAASSPKGIHFSHPVVVDEQRPGFEPDVKSDGKGVIYSSVPFGFSTTQSFVWSSRDHGNSYQFVPGVIGPGKPATCAGGGDTDLFLDARNALYFSDLQGLTNISNSKSTNGGATWTTNCVGAPNTPDDRMWFAGTGSSAQGNLTLYQDYDATNTSASGGNQLVETVSHDGTHFTPVVNTDPGAITSGCLGAAIQDCVTDNEGISGNQVVDPNTGNVYIAHTTINNNSSGAAVGVQVSEGKITPGTLTTATWSESPNLDGSLCPDQTCVDSSGNPEELAGENFASIARDSVGYLYVTFTAGPVDHKSSDPNFGALTTPEQIYVAHTLTPAGADPSKLTWSKAQAISGSGLSAGTNTFPWITAGSDGRVDVAWYHTGELAESGTCASGSGACTLHGASSLQKAEWSVLMGQSLDAHSATPSWTASRVSEAPVKHGQICTNGIGCVTGGDRSLGDFLQVTTDNQGAALVSYVFDTSADSSDGEDAGPEVISRQLSGPGLNAGTPVSKGQGPGFAMGSVSDQTGDDFYPANGTRTTGGPNLDLRGASLANGPNHTLVAKIDVRSLSKLSASSAVGGPDASWILRWTVVKPGTTGNGHIYYAGMDSNRGAGGSSKPSFFAGDTAGLPPPTPAEHTKYLTFPQTHKLNASQASYEAKSGVITLKVPLAVVGNPPKGTRLYSATAFSATSLTPQSSSTLFNLTDSTTPFELVIGAPGTGGKPGGGKPGGGKPPAGRCPKVSGRLSQQSLGVLKLRMTRSRARHLLPRFSTRHRRYMDFFCLRPHGVRAAYGWHGMLQGLKASEQKRLMGRVVLLLTASSHYALHGVRPGTSLASARRQLKLGRPFTVGRNDWYLVANGTSRGILKVQHKRVDEIGIVDKLPTRDRRQALRLLQTLH